MTHTMHKPTMKWSSCNYVHAQRGYICKHRLKVLQLLNPSLAISIELNPNIIDSQESHKTLPYPNKCYNYKQHFLEKDECGRVREIWSSNMYFKEFVQATREMLSVRAIAHRLCQCYMCASAWVASRIWFSISHTTSQNVCMVLLL